MVSIRVVVWDAIALENFKEIYDYLKIDENLSYANKVKNSILKEIKGLSYDPNLYEQDRFKVNNDGSFRAFEKFKYRIVYKITETQVRILRIRHTSRDPIDY